MTKSYFESFKRLEKAYENFVSAYCQCLKDKIELSQKTEHSLTEYDKMICKRLTEQIESNKYIKPLTAEQLLSKELTYWL
jgi:hypothetical protein